MGEPSTSERYPDTGFSVRDTPPEINQMMFERTMALSGAERLAMGCEMFDAARAMVAASLPEGLSDAERRRLIFKRIYAEELPELVEAR
jgi:hypothetical protein